MNNRENIKRRISNTPQDRISNIIFEKKNSTKARVKFGVKIILYVVIAGFLGSILEIEKELTEIPVFRATDDMEISI